MKTIKDIIELYKPKSADEDRFVKKHVIKKTEDANGNKDDVFNATNVKSTERTPKHGYNPGEDEQVYEGYEEIRFDDPENNSKPSGSTRDSRSRSERIDAEMNKLGNQYGRKNLASKIKKKYGPKNEETELDEARTKKSPIEKLFNRPSMQFAKKYTNKKSADEIKMERLGFPTRHLPKDASLGFTDTGTTSSLEGKAKQRKIEDVAKRTMQNNSYESDNELVLNPFLRGLLEATCKECGKTYKKGGSCSCCMKEDIQIDEILKPSMGAGAYIDDFVNSKDPKFAGKSKEKRRQMALAAYYAAKRGN